MDTIQAVTHEDTMRIQGRSARHWPWFGALALTLACPLGHAQSAQDIDVVALGRTLQGEIGDSVKVSTRLQIACASLRMVRYSSKQHGICILSFPHADSRLTTAPHSTHI